MNGELTLENGKVIDVVLNEEQIKNLYLKRKRQGMRESEVERFIFLLIQEQKI